MFRKCPKSKAVKNKHNEIIPNQLKSARGKVSLWHRHVRGILSAPITTCITYKPIKLYNQEGNAFMG